MTDWFRSWHGAPTDPKWLGIANKVGVPPGIVAAIVWALMDRASQASERGDITGYDADGLGAFFGTEPEKVDAIVAAMTDKGMLHDGRFVAWERRQPKREDDSAQRVREHRERAKQQSKRDVTQSNAPEEIQKADTEPSSLRSDGPRERAPDPAIVLQSVVDPMVAKRFVAHCAEKRRTLSSQQAESIAATLREVRKAGGNAAEALQFAINKGWVSLELEYLRNNGFPLRDPAGDQGAATTSWPVEKWRPLVEHWRATGNWNREALGPAPREAGCRAPAELWKAAA
jgi:hypothetical protein